MPLVLPVQGNYGQFSYCFTLFFDGIRTQGSEANVQDILYCNLDTQLYQDWVENGNNQDHKDNFEDENFWSATQSQQNEDRKAKNTHDVKENKVSDDNLDLPIIQKLANFIPPPKISIISGAKIDKSSHYIPQANIRKNQDIACCLVRNDVNKVQRQTAVKRVANIPQKMRYLL